MKRTLKDKLQECIGADDLAIAEVLECFKPIKTKRNQLIIDYEEICKYYYFIEKGSLRLYTLNAEGKESSRYFGFEGNFCTALPSFIDQQPALEYLQSLENCNLLAINRVNFFKMVEKHDFFARIYMEILELGFITAQKRIYGFQGFDAMEKVKWVIAHQPKLLLRISNKMVASYLGISPSTLSRIKGKM